jgi:pullulanase-type alpha-1,6-glucosidase
MDVVYNHTFAAGQQRLSVLDRIVPGYYQRLDAHGRLETSTCCANTATEHRMMGKLLVDTVLRWAVDYKVDSFRFDLMAHQPRALMQALQARLREATGHDVPLIGEGWNFGEVADGARFVQASQLSLNGSGIGTFNDRLRDAVRGGSAGDSGAALVERKGYVNGLGEGPEAASPQGRARLLHAADLVRTGLAGSIRSYPLTLGDGRTVPLDHIDYNGQPAGYASQPSEVVNYVENHDNLTLFDNNLLKLPRAASAEERARVQILGAAIVAFSQGVAYFHAGLDTLRSKSLDRNSFDSGDWFNRLDWSYRDNNFGAGLPPRPSNGADYALLQPLLADAALKPSPAQIGWTRDAFRDLLRIRASSSLFHLPTAGDVIARLHFANTGPDAVPTVIVGLLDGHGFPGAAFERVAYLINVDTAEQRVTVPELAGQALHLHPVQASPDAADARAREARFDSQTGTFSVPARTAVVFVR